MVNIQTLNELSQLRETGFGRPSPRHGLNLLYWFANDYITFTYGRIFPMKSPTSGAYGFHQFHNFHDHEDQLLPNQNLPYYDVGNLNAPRADQLPLYVRQKYTHHSDKSNMDRIMVRLNGDYLERVYITQHTNQRHFGNTYRISQGLLSIIKSMTLEEFLQQMNPPQINNQNRAYLQGGGAYIQPEPRNDSWCVLL